MARNSLTFLASLSTYIKYLGLAIILIFNYEQVFGQKQYPDWFLHSQDYPELIIGFSFAGVTTAEEDALWRYSYQKKGYIHGTASYFNRKEKWEKNYITEALVPLLQPKQIKKIEAFSTSPYMGGEEIAIYKRALTDSSNYQKFHMENPSQITPNWVKKAPFYIQGDNLYGVGHYVLKGNENDAWRTAEEKALVALASAIGIGVEQDLIDTGYHLEQSQIQSGDKTSNILTYEFNHEFSGASVLERWVDYDKQPQNGFTYVYVLMEIERNNIKQNLANGK